MVYNAIDLFSYRVYTTIKINNYTKSLKKKESKMHFWFDPWDPRKQRKREETKTKANIAAFVTTRKLKTYNHKIYPNNHKLVKLHQYFYCQSQKQIKRRNMSWRHFASYNQVLSFGISVLYQSCFLGHFGEY